MLNTARNSSVDSFDSAENDGPGPIDSTSALVLVPENDDSDIPYHFSSDDEEDGELDSSEIDWLSSSATSLSSSTVFLYLLSPFLTLGALFVPDATNTISIKFTIPALCIFALLSAFARYIWYMLARYVRKATMEDIVVNAFARTQRGETRRDFIKHVVKLGDAILRIFLALTFLRASVDVLLPISPPRLLFLSSRIVLTVILALSVSPLCLSSSFASRRVVIPTAVSVVTYVAWLASTAYSHATGSLDISASWVEMGSLWDAITAIAFAFTASSTVSLYGSLKSNHQHLRHKSAPKSFRTLLLVSALLALGLIIPSLFFISAPNEPKSATLPPRPLRACLYAATLVLTIPSIVVQTPTVTMPLALRRISSNLHLSRVATYAIVVLLSFVPTQIFAIFTNVTLVFALFSTYLLPAWLHIVIHNFRKPLSIVLPPQTSSSDGPAQPSASLADELLQRKEQKLQRRRLYRRLVWDLGVWILVLPIGGGGTAWAIGRLLGKW